MEPPPSPPVARATNPPATAAAGLRHVGRRGRLLRTIDVDVREAVEVRRLDGGQGRIELLEGRMLAGAEGVDQRTSVVLPRRIGHVTCCRCAPAPSQTASIV